MAGQSDVRFQTGGLTTVSAVISHLPLCASCSSSVNIDTKNSFCKVAT